MANTIQIRRGANADLPILNVGEFGFSTDSHQIYIGDGTTNHEIAYADQVGAVSALIGTVQYSDEGVGVSLGTLTNVVILDIIISVTTGFNDSGTDVINVGIDALHTHLVNGFNVDTVQYGEPPSINSWNGIGATPYEIFAYYEGANNDATNGVAKIIILYAKT